MLGTCKLTGERGKFVKSHLIPKALTRPAIPGNKFIEFGESQRPKRVADSWYDRQLVTRSGEDVLARYDNWGLAELRRLKLVWSSFPPGGLVESTVMKNVPGSPSFGLRDLRTREPWLLRLFFLSLLWRAAATRHPGFRSVHVDTKTLERLSRQLCDEDAAPIDLFPITLLQITSRGPVHNFTPQAIDTTFEVDGTSIRHYVYRIYMDGLIANFQRGRLDIAGAGPLIVGAGERLVVQTQLVHDSAQLANLMSAVRDSKIPS